MSRYIMKAAMGPALKGGNHYEPRNAFALP